MKIRRLRLHPERKRRAVAVLGLALLLLANLAGAAPQVSGRVTLAIVGGQVLDGTGAPRIADGVVLISGDRIASVVLAGAWQYLTNGVTTVRDGGAPIEILKVRDCINHGELVDARLFVAGPLLLKHHSELMTGWSWEVANAEDARQKVRQLAAADVDWIKIHGQIDFSEDEVAAIAEEAQRGHKPLADNAYQNDAEIARALKYHFKTFEHTDIGRAYEYSPDTIRSIIGADVCLDPTLAVRYAFFETERFPARRNDLIASQSLPTDLYQDLNSSLADYEHLASAEVDRRCQKHPADAGTACPRPSLHRGRNRQRGSPV